MDNQKSKKRDKEKKDFVQIDFLRFDMIDDFNYVMLGVDVAD